NWFPVWRDLATIEQPSPAFRGGAKRRGAPFETLATVAAQDDIHMPRSAGSAHLEARIAGSRLFGSDERADGRVATSNCAQRTGTRRLKRRYCDLGRSGGNRPADRARIPPHRGFRRALTA